uniref:C2H2-type domain-containing protein n=1 Tax=Acrobeloides nanus TaxID=290746 RepID=A0A914BUK1_9BILA
MTANNPDSNTSETPTSSRKNTIESETSILDETDTSSSSSKDQKNFLKLPNYKKTNRYSAKKKAMKAKILALKEKVKELQDKLATQENFSQELQDKLAQQEILSKDLEEKLNDQKTLENKFKDELVELCLNENGDIFTNIEVDALQIVLEKWTIEQDNANLRRQLEKLELDDEFKAPTSPTLSYEHDEKKPFNCEHCDKSYSTLSNMKRHIDIKHLEIKTECFYCGQPFTGLEYCRNYGEVHKNENIYKCEICGAKYTTKGGLRKHQRSMHAL